MADRKSWKSVWTRFDPDRPAAEPDWRVHREHSPAKQICDDLEVPMGGIKRFLLLGSIGSGKSTELLAVAEARGQHGPVVFLDLVEHFYDRIGDSQALQRVQAWEILLLIGLGIYHAGDMFGHTWTKEDLALFDQAGRGFAPKDSSNASFDAAKLASSVAALVGGRATSAAARPWLERACAIAQLDCDLLAALDLLDGRADRGLSRLEPLLGADQQPKLRERQLLVLALRMNGESKRAAALIERWTNDGAHVEDFEFGPPRAWLTKLLQRAFSPKAVIQP